ncbi:MAG: CDP-glycerol glycerophosphotransferase family protein [Bacteroidia bacterium]|nr:CDP-glycerol glycerophosphotransferase family protein [Bacteroidia bacterium]
MSKKENAYYLDTIGDFDIPSNAKIYVAETNKAITNALPVTVKNKQKLEVYRIAHEEIVDFYNAHSSVFMEWENSQQFNLWFLEQFRMYFNYREIRLRAQYIENFLTVEPDGIVLTSDHWILNRFKNKTQLIDGPKATPKNTGGVKKLMREFVIMLARMRFRKPPDTDVVLFSKLVDQVDGKDQRMGQLEKSYNRIISRPLFDKKARLDKDSINTKLGFNTDHIFIQYLSRLTFPMHLRTFTKAFSKLLDTLQNSAQNDTVSQFVLGHLRSNKLSLMLYFLKFKSMLRFFKRSNIKAVIMSDENSPQHKVIQYAAWACGVKSFGLQHGNIDELHQSYMFGRYNNRPLLCNATFTWGNYYSDLLISDGGYAQDAVITTGRIEPVTNVRKVHPKLPRDQKIVVYATQPIPDSQLRKQHVKDVMYALKGAAADFCLVLRPHPREKDDSYFNAIASEVGLSHFIIDRESDLKTHFERAHMLITSYSTVGSEFVPYNKPLLVLDYLEQDLMSWVKKGVGHQITNRDKLVAIFQHSPPLDVDTVAHDTFTAQFFYKNDGLAHERIVTSIEQRLTTQY